LGLFRPLGNIDYNGSVNVYAVQLDIAWEDKKANFAAVRRLLADSRPESGALLVLPEMFATGFSMSAAVIAEDAGTGETSGFLAETARAWRNWVLGGVAIRSEAGAFRNEALLFRPDGALAARYAKMYPFTPGGEAAHYSAGEAPVVVADVSGFALSPFVCYDLRFPEAFREAVGRGAEVYTVIASWPEARIGHWVTLLQARAIENQAYVVGVNRCGADPTLRYPGRSLIVGPDGVVLADAGAGEGIISATLDRTALLDYRTRLPFLNDRRHSAPGNAGVGRMPAG
jgi:Predicted amidohydrolase